MAPTFLKGENSQITFNPQLPEMGVGQGLPEQSIYLMIQGFFPFLILMEY